MQGGVLTSAYRTRVARDEPLGNHIWNSILPAHLDSLQSTDGAVRTRRERPIAFRWRLWVAMLWVGYSRRVTAAPHITEWTVGG